MRRARDCAAGVIETLAIKSLVAVSAKFCAKRGNLAAFRQPVKRPGGLFIKERAL